MKISIKLVILAVVIVLGLMLSYNYALKAEYEKGDYKKPLYGYRSTNFRDFSKVIIKTANEISVEIRQSDTFAVKTDMTKYLKIEQFEDHLMVDLERVAPQYLDGGRHVVIFMPHLKEVITSGYERMKEVAPGKLVPVKRNFGENETVIHGFRQDSMKLVLAGNSSVVMRYCNTGQLNAMVGGLLHEHSRLAIDRTDTIGAAVIGVQNRNELNLSDAQIRDVKLDLSEDCRVILGGKSLALINKELGAVK